MERAKGNTIGEVRRRDVGYRRQPAARGGSGKPARSHRHGRAKGKGKEGPARVLTTTRSLWAVVRRRAAAERRRGGGPKRGRQRRRQRARRLGFRAQGGCGLGDEVRGVRRLK
jgi:hypothetical protein